MPPRLTALGRIYVSSSADEYMRSVEVEAELAGGNSEMTQDDESALTEAVPDVSKSGSWLEACSSCLGADLELLVEPDSEHCRECGVHQNASARRESLS